MVKIVSNYKEANCITHNGTMHADEVFATAFLDLYRKNIVVFRTSIVPQDLDKDVLVYDIGRGEFDHHQINSEKRENNIPYSSIGLLWKKFGKDFLREKDFEYIDEIHRAVDKDLIEGIDADDNGIFPKIESNYKVKTLSSIIKIFNPSFDSSENESTQFLKAVDVAKRILEEEILYIRGKVIADKKIEEILRYKNEEDKYLILEEYLPYEESLLNNEKANNILFVAFPSNRGGYAIKTIPKNLEDKTSRLAFPEEWAGLHDEELERASGIEGLVFCHTGRFICSCKNINSVYQVFDKLCK